MKCRYRLTLADGQRSAILEMPQDDWFAGHLAMLEAMGIHEKGPVPDEKAAQEIARIALRRYRDSVAQGAGNGKLLKGKRNASK